MKRNNDKPIYTYREHAHLRPMLYVGKLGDGSSCDDGIYYLIKCAINNAISESVYGLDRTIEMQVDYELRKISIRNHGRGILLSQFDKVVSELNAGIMYDSHLFEEFDSKILLVYAMSCFFKLETIYDGKTRTVHFTDGELTYDSGIITTNSNDTGTLIEFILDDKIFRDYYFLKAHIEHHIWNCLDLNRGFTIRFNNCTYCSDGLSRLLEHELQTTPLYPIIHIVDGDFEAAFTHVNNLACEQYYSFVNGFKTSEGGIHEIAFRDAYIYVIKNFFEEYHASPRKILKGLVCALSVRVKHDYFENSMRTKMTVPHLGPYKTDGSTESPLLTTYVRDILQRNLYDYLRIHPQTANALLQKIKEK